MKDFLCKILLDTIVLNTYKIVKKSANGLVINYSLRSSIWRFEGDRWRFLFHQGTLTKL